jgi:hypothetical protein
MVLPVSDRDVAAVVSGRERALPSRKAGDPVRFYSCFDYTANKKREKCPHVAANLTVPAQLHRLHSRSNNLEWHLKKKKKRPTKPTYSTSMKPISRASVLRLPGV